MAQSVEMPELGESVTEGTITRWLKQVGDTVEADEPLLEVSTDKVDTEIPSPAAGVIVKIMYDEDDTVDVGEIICEIGEEDEAAAADPGDGSDDGDCADQSDQDDAPAPKSTGGSGETTDVEMPELGESVTEGTITRWLKSVGDTVDVDEPLLEVSTDKVDTEVPSPVAGTIVEILAEEDDTVDVGSVIVRIGDPDAAPAQPEEDKDVPSEKAIEESESKDDNATVDQAEKEKPAKQETTTDDKPAPKKASSG